ncbi:MAG: aldolase [Magnetovibrionaceae bacterium]
MDEDDFDDLLEDLEEIETWRAELACALRWAARLGFHEGICNHFSVAVSDQAFLINPLGLHWSKIMASDLIIVDGEGNTLEGEGEVERTALEIHAAVHRAAIQRADEAAFCVLHTHMPFATALCCSEAKGLKMVHQNSTRFLGRWAFDPDYRGLALEASEGDRIAAAKGTSDILFLAHHGVMVSGPSVAQAFDDLYYLEKAAEIQVRAAPLGLIEMPADIAEQTAAQWAEEGPDQAIRHFEALRAILDEEEPDYAE